MLDVSPATKIDTVLSKLGNALENGDIDAAVNLFQADCYWRDLATFTWNLKTLEGREQIRDMLTSQLSATKPSGFVQDVKEQASKVAVSPKAGSSSKPGLPVVMATSA